METMAFVEHAVNWVKGEIFESWMFGLWGGLIVVMAAFFWWYRQAATARALIVPFLVVGLFWGIIGLVNVQRNKQRIVKVRQTSEEDPATFVKSEKHRVDDFIKWYRPLLIGWSVLILIGLALFNFWGGNLGRAIGLAVILFGVTGLMVDHTSEHNALKYKAEITKALKL